MTSLVLTTCPVIIPPREGVVESWTHHHHHVVVNGAHDHWTPILQGRGWLTHTDPERRNLGCPASWNLAFIEASRRAYRWVIILSQSTALAAGTAELANWIERRAPADRIVQTSFDFHCIAIPVAVWRRVGGFDESLPIFADIDFYRRAELAGIPPYGRLTLAGRDEYCAAARAGAIPESLYDLDAERYATKWGGPARAETLTQPRWEPLRIVA